MRHGFIFLLSLLLVLFLVPRVYSEDESGITVSQQKEYVKLLVSKISHARLSLEIYNLAEKAIVLGMKNKMHAEVVTAMKVKCSYLSQYATAERSGIVEEAVREMMNYVKLDKDKTMYFYAWTCLCNYYLRFQQYAKAFKQIEAFRIAADRLHQPRFVCWSELLLANVYRKQLRNYPAIDQYYYVAKLGLQAKDYELVSTCYTNIASVHIRMKSVESAEYVLHQNLDFLSKHPQIATRIVKSEIYGMLGICYYYYHKYDEMKQMFDSIKYLRGEGTELQRWVYRRLRAHCLIVDKKYEAASCLIDSIQFPISRYQLHDAIYQQQNKYKEAAENMKKLVLFKRNTILEAEKSYDQLQNILSSINNTNARNRNLKSVNQRLNLNSKLTVATLKRNEQENMNLHQLLKMQEREQKVQETNRKLMYERQRQHEMEKNMQAEKNMSRIRLIVIFVSLIICFIFIVGFIYYFRRRNKYIERLRELEKETTLSLEAAQKLQHEAESLLSKAVDDDKVKSRFIQNISYGVRTSLNAIVGFSGLLSDDAEKVDKSTEKYFNELVERESSRLTLFINDILDIANLSTGKYKMQSNPTTLADICDMAISSISDKVSHDVEIRVSHSNLASERVVYLDLQRIVQVLQKLLDNACKFTEKGIITLSCTIVGEKIVFCVTDTGIGIPQDKAEIIFKRFIKLDEYVPGFGLGLSICKAVADRVDGSVWCDTEYQSGARFYFEMPLIDKLPQKGGES